MCKRILVVDDESDICFVLEQVLGENGFVVDSYKDPFIALEKFKADSYNLVILDIKMPDLNGSIETRTYCSRGCGGYHLSTLS